MVAAKGPAGVSDAAQQRTEGDSGVTARLESIRMKTRASEERLESVVRAVEAVRAEFHESMSSARKEMARRLELTEARNAELETKVNELRRTEEEAHTRVGTKVATVRSELDSKIEELNRELTERMGSMERSEQEIEARLKRFEEIGERLKVMISATEHVGPDLKGLLGAVEDMRSDLGTSVATMATVREDLHASVDALTQAQAELAQRVAALDARVATLTTDVEAVSDRIRAELEQSLSERVRTVEASLTGVIREAEASAAKVHAELRSTSEAAERRAAEIRELVVLSPGEFPYFRFEDLHRGTAESVRDSLRPFVRHFVRSQRVVDLGCGRGEFLDLCKTEGIGAYGVDSNDDMVLHCQRIGLDVVRADVVDHVRELKDKSVDGVFCSQVVEHLPMRKVQTLLRECFRALKVGTHLIVVTINPMSLYALANNFYLDPTHVRPLPPETLRFLAEDAGFRKLSVSYWSPFGPDYTLLPVHFEQETEEQRAIRVNFDRLNHVVFGYQEYALIALK